MSRAAFSHLLHCVHQLAGARQVSEGADGQLLVRFVARQDEEAFGLLVQRHGPMVLAVCRRILRNAHDAEDAFQATFLVLARKAATISQRESLGGWLYEVAYHAALRSRSNALRRQDREKQASAMVPADSLAEVDRHDLCAILDEELHQLPRNYRLPLVLCYLQGKTNVQAARELRWPPGSMSRHLERAREELRRRLVRRGVALASASVATALTATAATAGVPNRLAESTIQAALLFAAGKSGAVVPVLPAAVLAEGILRTMAVTRMKLLAVLLTAVALLGAAFGAVAYRGTAVGEADAPRQPTPQQIGHNGGEDRPPGPAAHADVLGDPLPPNAQARLGTIRWRQAGLFFVGCLPDGVRLLTVSRDGNIRFWDAATGKETQRWDTGTSTDLASTLRANLLKGNTDMKAIAAILDAGGMFASDIAAVRLSGNGGTLALVTWDGAIRVWDVAAGKERQRIKPDPRGGARAVVVSPDGKRLAVRGKDRVIHIYDAATGQDVRQLGRPVALKDSAYDAAVGDLVLLAAGWTDVAFAPDGRTLLAKDAGPDSDLLASTGPLTIWDLATGKSLRQIKKQTDGDNIFVLSPDGRTLAFRRQNGTVRLWDVDTDREVRLLGAPQPAVSIPAVTFSPDGKLLAARTTDGLTRLWEVTTGKELAKLGEFHGSRSSGITQGLNGLMQLTNAAFSPDGRTLISEGHDNTIRRWDIAAGKDQAVAGHQGAIFTLALGANGTSVFTRGQDNTIRRWDTLTGKELGHFRLPTGVWINAFSADGRQLAFGSEDGTVHLWDTGSGKEIRRLDGKVQVSDLAFSADGTTVAAKDTDRRLVVWDVATGRQLHVIRTELDAAAESKLTLVVPFEQADLGAPSLVFSPDGRTLACRSYHRGSLVIDMATKRVTQGDNTRVHLWDALTGQDIGQLEGLHAEIGSFIFSPDGRSIAVATADGVITLHETATGKVRCRFQDTAAIASVTALAFSPDGQILAAGRADHTIRCWDVRTARACGHLQGHQGAVTCLAFAADGQTLISGSADTTAMVWKLTELTPAEQPRPLALTASDTAAAWADLASTDAARAYRAMRILASAQPGLLRLPAWLRPEPPPDGSLLARLIGELTDDRFAVRQAAAAELTKLGEPALPSLRQALANKPSLEVCQRIEQILDNIASHRVLPIEQLRTLRAVEALEQAGTAEARQTLERLAQGAPGARLTREAQAALRRLAR